MKVQPLPPPSRAPITVGEPVRVRSGVWQGRRGRVHPLTESVGGEVSLVIELDARSRRGAGAPKTGLIVVARDTVMASPLRRGRRTDQAEVAPIPAQEPAGAGPEGASE